MNRYFLVIDSKSRLVFKKKLSQGDNEDILVREFKKLDYSCHFPVGETFSAALTQHGINLAQESAFYFKRQLKEELYFTDKRIKELLGAPDRIEKVQGSSDKF